MLSQLHWYAAKIDSCFMKDELLEAPLKVLSWVATLDRDDQELLLERYLDFCRIPDEEVDDNAVEVEEFFEEFKLVDNNPAVTINSVTGEFITDQFPEITEFRYLESMTKAKGDEEFEALWIGYWNHVRAQEVWGIQAFEEDLITNITDEEFERLIDSFHLFYGRNPEHERERREYLSEYNEAQLAARSGDMSKLELLKAPSKLVLTAIEEKKRITMQPGDCYICKRIVKAFQGELLLWNEIPKSIREEFIPGVYQKWHVRHLEAPCSNSDNGQREHPQHIKLDYRMRNTKAEACWLCGVIVAEKAGWLVRKDQIPKWKQQHRAFPGAKEKQYYVQCTDG